LGVHLFFLRWIHVLSFQCFSTPDRICPDLRRWHELTGKLVLLADVSMSQPA
jgi:hypothetical protein